MTQFMSKSFSVALGLDEQGRKNYDRIFRKKPGKAFGAAHVIGKPAKKPKPKKAAK